MHELEDEIRFEYTADVNTFSCSYDKKTLIL